MMRAGRTEGGARSAPNSSADLVHCRRPMVRRKDLAAFLKASLPSVDRWVAEGHLPPPTVRLGNTPLWSPSILDDIDAGRIGRRRRRSPDDVALS